MKKLIYTLLLIGLLITKSEYVSAQQFKDLSLEEQIDFYEGYWKYNSLDRDTIFIIKLKYFVRGEDIHVLVGSYLYFEDGQMISDNLWMLDEYLSCTNYDQYLSVRKKNFNPKLKHFSPSIRVSEISLDSLSGSFFDYTYLNSFIELIISPISSEIGKEKLSWNLELTGCVIFVNSEEEEKQFNSISLPRDLILHKMYDLSEFEDKGIFLKPFPKLGR